MANIITLDSAGINNRDLVAATERLQNGGVWKKQRIVYVIPGGASIPAEVYLNHRGIVFPPNQPMTPLYVKGAEVGEAFQAAIDLILGNPELSQWEYVLTVEHDHLVPQNGVLKLLEAMEKHPEYAVISGLYWTEGGAPDGSKGWEGSGVPQIWGDIRDPVMNFRPQPPRPGEVVECYGTGMGFALWRISMFKTLAERGVPKPWFKTLGRNSDDRGVGTQDLYFHGQVARPNGFRCAVDCSCLVGHYDAASGLTW